MSKQHGSLPTQGRLSKHDYLDIHFLLLCILRAFVVKKQ